MRGRFLRFIVLMIAVVAFITVAIYYVSNYESINNYTQESNVEFSPAEKEYIRENKIVKIYVEEQLDYLMSDSDGGYINEYLETVFSDVGLRFLKVSDESKANCSLYLVTENIRKSTGENQYTSPLFQMDGRLFVRNEKNDKGMLIGVAVDNRISKQKLRHINIDGKPIRWYVVPDNKTAVEYTKNKNIDCILGDENVILNEMPDGSRYISQRETAYSLNGCIIVTPGERLLGSIINKCLHGADRQEISYEMSQRWLDGRNLYYMASNYADMYSTILIIIMAVIIVFFLYYQSNKNLYNELTERMNMLKESKKELQTTFNGVAYYMAELSMKGDIIDINKAFYNFLNEDVINKKIWDVLQLEQKESEKLKEMVVLSGIERKAHSMELILKKRTLEIDMFLIENAKISDNKLLFMGMDVTNERMAERQLIQDNKMIAVGQLAAGVAHEIRNPLGIIRNYCYVLKNMKEESVKEKALEQIEKSVEKADRIINSLLNFSRVSKSSGEYIDVKEHVKSLMVLNENILKKKSIYMKIECDEIIKTFIPTESLDMILMNLVSNATDAMSEFGIITISMEKSVTDFYITVSDTGCGIESDVINDIFNPFFTTKEGNKGNGLGLYIVYNEVMKMNGEINVESVPGEGSNFVIRLPLKEESTDV